jgi:hypothetical protein
MAGGGATNPGRAKIKAELTIAARPGAAAGY